MKQSKNLHSSNTALLVLSLLKESDKYGYQMINDLALRSEQVFQMKEGTLYPILHSLEKEGALRSYEKAAPTGRVRKYYAITDKGCKELQEKQAQWEEFSHAVHQVLSFS